MFCAYFKGIDRGVVYTLINPLLKNLNGRIKVAKTLDNPIYNSAVGCVIPPKPSKTLSKRFSTLSLDNVKQSYLTTISVEIKQFFGRVGKGRLQERLQARELMGG